MEEVMGKIVDAKEFLEECSVLEEKKKNGNGQEKSHESFILRMIIKFN